MLIYNASHTELCIDSRSGFRFGSHIKSIRGQFRNMFCARAALIIIEYYSMIICIREETLVSCVTAVVFTIYRKKG